MTQRFGMKIYSWKSQTMAFRGKWPVHFKIVLQVKILEQVNHFKYLGFDLSLDLKLDVQNDLNKFNVLRETIHRNLKTRTKK